MSRVMASSPSRLYTIPVRLQRARNVCPSVGTSFSITLAPMALTSAIRCTIRCCSRPSARFICSMWKGRRGTENGRRTSAAAAVMRLSHSLQLGGIAGEDFTPSRPATAMPAPASRKVLISAPAMIPIARHRRRCVRRYKIYAKIYPCSEVLEDQRIVRIMAPTGPAIRT